MTPKVKVLVLGGTGMVGAHVCREAVQRGMAVTSFTRSKPRSRSEPYRLQHFDVAAVDWQTGDATDEQQVKQIINTVEPDAVVHCVGALFDEKSWFASMNPAMSGAGSDCKGSYNDLVVTPMVASLSALAAQKGPNTFIFVSACEVGWVDGDKGFLGRIADTMAPPFLKRYLQAKREAEALLKEETSEATTSEGERKTRCVVWRPSLILSDAAPRSGISTMMKYSPVADPPVQAASLARGIVDSVQDTSYHGVYRVKDLKDI
ncbi:MIOREX complex component 2 [Diplonema papillatum]|nr:MIOREX complex component 2 [Diplonema papillatum]|eukprot:gene16851-25837_t